MDTEVKKEFEKLAVMVADGFAQMDTRFDEVNVRFDETNVRITELAKELRDEIQSVRRDIEKLPDEIDQTYSKTINDLLDRVSILEKRLAVVEATQS